MATYINLTNELLREMNEVELTAANFLTSVGIQSHVKDAINRAYFDIVNEEPQWPFLSAGESGDPDPNYGNVYIETVAGTRWYELKPASSSITTDYGYVDFDITDGIFYTPLNGINGGTILSIYDLTNGLDFTGHYFDAGGQLSNGKDIFYKNNKLKVGQINGSMEIYDFYDYDGSNWFENNYVYTNIKTQNSQYGTNAGVMEFLLDDENLPANFPPISQGRTANLWANNTETINIQLTASDQDGDALTYILVDPPSDGSVVFTETQGGGVVSYTSTPGFFGPVTFSYKASDGINESEVAQMSIEVKEKEPSLNWARFYSTAELKSSINDDQKNTYMAGKSSISIS